MSSKHKLSDHIVGAKFTTDKLICIGIMVIVIDLIVYGISWVIHGFVQLGYYDMNESIYSIMKTSRLACIYLALAEYILFSFFWNYSNEQMGRRRSIVILIFCVLTYLMGTICYFFSPVK